MYFADMTEIKNGPTKNELFGLVRKKKIIQFKTNGSYKHILTFAGCEYKYEDRVILYGITINNKLCVVCYHFYDNKGEFYANLKEA